MVGTVKGDIHDIGKNLVGMMAEGAGFEVHDIGVDQSAQKFLDAAARAQPTIVAMSALLTTTMSYMKTVIDGFRAAGLGHVKFAVGGAPVTQAFADEIGAAGYAPDAGGAAGAGYAPQAVQRRLVGWLRLRSHSQVGSAGRPLGGSHTALAVSCVPANAATVARCRDGSAASGGGTVFVASSCGSHATKRAGHPAAHA